MSSASTQICGVVLPHDVAKEARIVAAMEGKSRSQLMRDLLLDYLAKNITSKVTREKFKLLTDDNPSRKRTKNVTLVSIA